MSNEDPTTVLKMLNELKSSTNSHLCYNSLPSQYSRTKVSSPISFMEDKNTPPKRKKVDSIDEKMSFIDSESAPGSPWEWRRLRGEVVSLKTQLLHQEANVQQLHHLRRQMEEVFQKEKNLLEMRAELDKQAIKQLELRLESTRKCVQEAQTAQAIAENERSLIQQKLENEISSLKREKEKLLENIKKLNEPKSCTSSSIPQGDISSYNIQLELARKRIQNLEQKFRESHKLQQELELQKVENQNLKLEIETLKSERDLWQEKKLLYSETSRANDLEKDLNTAKETIESMRESIKGKLLLEEQMSNIKQRLEHTEQIEQRLAFLEVEYNQLSKILNEYNSINIANGPVTLKKEIHRLQQAEIVLTAEEGLLRSQLESMQREYQALCQNFEATKINAAQIESSNEKLNVLINRLQKKIILITKERDNYRQQVEMYEKEIAIDSNNILQGRVIALERALEGYRDLVSKLEADLDTYGTVTSREECQQLREEIEILRRELEHRVLKGDFNCKSRVLHLKHNPAALANQQAQEKMHKLQQEIEKLRQYVQSENLGPINVTSQCQEVSEVKQIYDIKITRLKDAFKTSSQEYRQACYQLFGWRVDRTKEGRYKLSSQYAESPDDFLFFQVAEGVDLLETEFSATLEPLIDRHLKTQHSVPMFLCAVQTELFSQQTMTSLK
ncbi:mitotic spindle assembly checkpoint protein MAD1 [Chelonus insularis]|uniref:mitotic spindle assembly checkpoint protein MAD1 n=1 Tax=Chelonus insularis TaxID=460826 RepID=UPI00158D7355|nr:mitotic spindle assembly checkpoint protein MAD1 [Chelonus insularis]